MVAIQSNPKLAAHYQRLLMSDWTSQFPKEVLSLLWKTVCGAAQPAERDPLLPFLDPEYSAAVPVHHFQAAARRIAEGTAVVRLAELPPIPPDYVPPHKLSGPAGRAIRLAIYLTLPAHVPVSGDVDFLADVQALAFQAALHFVLPSLAGSHEAEHALLIHSATLCSLASSAYDPAHFAYTMSMIHGYLGNEDQRLRSLLSSFRFTPPQDHSYLTKAQECWMTLLDSSRYEEAEDFLLTLHRVSLPAQHDEVRAMIVDGFNYILSATHGHG